MFPKTTIQLLDSPDFKEDSVREVIILPILQRLGYEVQNIVRSKNLEHPFIKIGSKRRAINLVPDYLLKVEENYAWVLDAKSPTENIQNSDHIEQVYSYAIHPEVRTKFFALCNGKEFILFRQDQEKPVLYFPIRDIENHWENLETLLAPSAFQAGKQFTYSAVQAWTLTQDKNTAVSVHAYRNKDFDYLSRPLLDEIPVKKQACKRHFGVTAYFTRQSWDILQAYIRNFTQEGDIILDPFAGSGVTGVEALMTNRKAIHIDINPISTFMTTALVTPVRLDELKDAFDKIKKEYEKSNIENFKVWNEKNQEKWLKKYPYPTGFKLPKGADVEVIEELFSNEQLAQLAFLKHLILKEKKENIRKSLLLAFYNTLSVCNLTFHESPRGGGANLVHYYRYRVAPTPAMQEVMRVFERKFKRVVKGKQEIEYHITEKTINNLQVLKGTATDLSGFENLTGLGGVFTRKKGIPNESIDYIYTDPPYGKKIPYLDLSTMWNAWLDLEVTDKDFKLEAIEGGEQNKSKEEYNSLISKSIEEMYRVLKFDRWMSFVFAHKDPEFWHLIVETAERCGFEYAGAVAQKNGQTSFKKRQNPFTVLSGQLIINFKKVRKPKAIMKAALGMNTAEIIIQTTEGVIAKNNGASLEQINDELIIKGLELGFLDLLKKEYSDLTPFLLGTFDYDKETELFSIRKNQKFKTHIDLNLRVRYYLISYLRRMERENKKAHFDEIVLNILPLLKNGITPEEQTILKVLEDIAERVGDDSWKLKKEGQRDIF